MTVANSEIADILEELADLLEIEGDNPFRIRAYRNAARTVRGQARPLAELVRDGADLARLPGIGDAIAAKIVTIVETGHLPQLEKLEHRTPAALVELLRIEGLGPKRVERLHRELGIRSIEDLRRALDSGKVRALHGFGARTEARIREQVSRGIEQKRLRLADAETVAAPLVAWLAETDGVTRVTVAGSFRRRRETVGDLDILVTAGRGTPVMERFADYDQVAEVVARGSTRSTVRLRSGLQVDLRLVPAVSHGAALQYFTGSKAHNIALRKRAARRGLKINEYGVHRGDKRIAGRTETEVYRAVGLPLIAPELRENHGEIEAAAQGRLPTLVTLEDIRGDLHCHTRATDGHDSIEAMAAAARDRGYGYLAISDHSQHVTVAHGMDAKRLLAQVRAIDRLNEKLGDIVLLKSCEVDILEDGSLDRPDAVLRELDVTVCAIHYKLRLPEGRQTPRIIKAMDNPYVTILAHPTGRLINSRAPYGVDMGRVIEAARERGCFLELNAQPDRLDITDAICREAKKAGVKVAISTDAHSGDGLALMRHGVDQARRGWLEADDVLNTRPLPELRRLLRRRQGVA